MDSQANTPWTPRAKLKFEVPQQVSGPRLRTTAFLPSAIAHGPALWLDPIDARPRLEFRDLVAEQRRLFVLEVVCRDHHFLLQFAHTRVEGGPQAGTVNPTSTDPLDERSFSSNSVALRAQVDF